MKMKFFSFTIALVMGAFVSVSAQKTVVDIAVGSKAHTTLVAAVKAAVGTPAAVPPVKSVPPILSSAPGLGGLITAIVNGAAGIPAEVKAPTPVPL